MQLPLYAGLIVEDGEKLGGLVFAKVRAGKHEFAGFVEDAKATLIRSLRGNTNLVKKPLTDEQCRNWKEHIEKLAKNFLSGRADVDPREYPKTCERCGLQTLCRIQESQVHCESEDDPSNEEVASE